MWTGVLLLSLAAAAPPERSVPQTPSTTGACATWQACRDQVEAALAAESFELAHDLAWRAVQMGPKDDAALMFLLARAQARAGRPQDALVMIRRIAERGVATEAITHPDLERTRDLAGWPDVETIVARANGTAAATATASTVSPAAAAPPPPVVAPKPSANAPPAAAAAAKASDAPAARSKPARGPAMTLQQGTATEVTQRFTSDRFVPSGLAYDAVSQRFVVGDRHGRKLRVVGEGLDHAVDLVRAESAGFHDVRVLAIDTRRGDLWVATSEENGTSATLHRIQLISGRPLQSIMVGGTSFARPVDLAVAESGAVLMLMADGRVLRARAGAAALEPVLQPDLDEAYSLALSSNDAVAFLTHRGGMMRVDLNARTSGAVEAAAELPLTAIERLRAHRNGFVALQRGPDGERRLLRLELTRNGRAVRGATTYDVRVAAGSSPTAFAVTGDEVALVSDVTPGDASASPALGPPAELIVRRLHLR